MFSAFGRNKKTADVKKKGADAGVGNNAAPAPVPAPAPNVAAAQQAAAAPALQTPKPTVDIAFNSVVGLSRSATSLAKPPVSPGVAQQPGLDVPRIKAQVPEGTEGSPAAWINAVSACDLSGMAALLKSGGIVIDQEIDDVRMTAVSKDRLVPHFTDLSPSLFNTFASRYCDFVTSAMGP